MKLLVDDLRNYPEADVIVRDPEIAKGILELYRFHITHLYLDNDMGVELEGWQLMEWAIENRCLPLNIQLVTSNSSAAGRMENALRAEGYTKKGSWWIKDLSMYYEEV